MQDQNLSIVPGEAERVGEPGQAERAAEVQRKIDQMRDPSDPYNGEHEEGRGE
jgi:hypothetical protein